MSSELFITVGLADRTGVSVDSIRDWRRRGIIDLGTAIGTRNYAYSSRDADVIRLAARLSEYCNLKAAFEMAKIALSDDVVGTPEYLLWSPDDEVATVCSAPQLASVVSSRDALLVISWSAVVEPKQ